MINKYFYKRKSIRHFDKQEIPDDKLNSILEAAFRAPTCGNMQLYSAIITRDPKKKKILEQCHYNQPAAVTSNVIITICADFYRFTRWCELKNAGTPYNNFHSFIMAMTDAVIYAQQAVTIAEMEGISSCYLGTVTYNAKEISALLKLPKLVIPVAAIALGILQKDEPDVERLSKDAIIFEEEYPKMKDEEILNFFEIKENFPLNKKYVEENKKENLAQIFTNIRYPKEMNEKISKSFYKFLIDQGFIN